MLEKKCNGCKIIKDVKEFYINRSNKDGLQYNCKVCNKKYSKKNRENNKDRLLEWRENNKDRKRKYDREYYEENKARRRIVDREYYENNKVKIKEYNKKYERNRRSNDPLYKLSRNVRTLIGGSLKNGGYTKNSKTNNILCCSYEELLDHLNNNKYGFVYGDENLDIDHIIPLSKATSEDEIIKLNHYTNLQLLPADYNRHIKRDNDFDKEDFERWLEKNNNK